MIFSGLDHKSFLGKDIIIDHFCEWFFIYKNAILDVIEVKFCKSIAITRHDLNNTASSPTNFSLLHILRQ